MENLKTLILSITDVTDVSCRTPSRKIEFFTTPFPYHEQIASLQKHGATTSYSSNMRNKTEKDSADLCNAMLSVDNGWQIDYIEI